MNAKIKKIFGAALVIAVMFSVFATNSISVSAVSQKNVASGTYIFYSALGSNMALDIDNASTKSGANAQIYKFNSTNAQKFEVKKSGDWYTIKAVCSGMALDVAGGSKESGANVQQYTPNGTDAQKWSFYDAGNGYYYIRSKVGSMALDVSGGGSSNGTNVQVCTPNGTSAQKWKLVKTTKTVTPAAPTQKSLTIYKNKFTSGYCTVKISDTLLNRKGKQNATVRFKTYDLRGKSTNGKCTVTLKDENNRTIWSGQKNGGDTLKLGDDHSIYRIYVQPHNEKSGVIGSGNNFINSGKCVSWSIDNAKNCKLYQ